MKTFVTLLAFFTCVSGYAQKFTFTLRDENSNETSYSISIEKERKIPLNLKGWAPNCSGKVVKKPTYLDGQVTCDTVSLESVLFYCGVSEKTPFDVATGALMGRDGKFVLITFDCSN